MHCSARWLSSVRARVRWCLLLLVLVPLSRSAGGAPQDIWRTYLPYIASTSPVIATYYVAPNGQPGNPGTQAQPFASIAQARDVLRTRPRTNGTMAIALSTGRIPARRRC